MPKLYWVRHEDGHDGPLRATKAEAVADFDWWIEQGCEPEGLHSAFYRSTRQGVAALVNSFRESTAEVRAELAEQFAADKDRYFPEPEPAA